MEYRKIVILLIFFIILGMFASLYWGSVSINWQNVWEENSTDNILFSHRVIRLLTAMLVGIALPISGMLLQEYFKNVLAGPSVLGISSFAGLGIASFIFLGLPVQMQYVPDSLKNFTLVGAGLLGAFICLLLLVSVAGLLKDQSSFIIVGFLLSAFAGAIVSVMQFYSENNQLKSYVFWTFGSLSDLSYVQLLVYGIMVFIGGIFAYFAIKSLQGNILGMEYAQSVGVNLQSMKFWVLLATAILTGATTAFVGPVAFVGIIIPFFTRKLVQNSNLYRQAMINILLGIFILLVVNLLMISLKLPINVLTSLIGIPVLFFILFYKPSKK